jgi:hypothetical protein
MSYLEVGVDRPDELEMMTCIGFFSLDTMFVM